MTVALRYKKLLDEIRAFAIECGRDPEEIKVVAVSKNHPWEIVKAAYDAGCRDFGESYVQEALDKIYEAPSDISWHLVGSVQRKKISKIIGRFSLIHSVDSVELAEKISRVSKDSDTQTRILVEVNTSGENSKHGLAPNLLMKEFEKIKELPHLIIEGLMTIAPYSETDQAEIRSCFKELRRLRDQLKLKELSMGMTNDYRIAIEEGATILRIGTAIFGQRKHIKYFL